MKKRFFISPRNIIATVVLCGSFGLAQAQSTEAGQASNHRWVFYGGIGPNYYFNNLEIGKSQVKEINYSFVARLMWEPEYNLRLGFETGYNRLYSMSGTSVQTGDVSIVNVAIPLQIVVSMKFFKNFYGNFNLGFAILQNNVTTQVQGNFDASVVSLGDFAATFGYRRDISERFTLGAELKGYYSGKLQDKNLALVFMGGYRFW